MNILIKILHSLFARESDEIIESDSRYVYIDSQDRYLVDEKDHSASFNKKEILERFKSVYQKRRHRKTLFGSVIHDKIYIVEIRKIPFKDLKERYISSRKKEKAIFSEVNSQEKKEILLLFVSTHLKPELQSPHVHS